MMRRFYCIYLLCLFGCAGTAKQVPGDWVSETLASMTVEQKIGQMMVPAFTPRFFNKADPELHRILKLVKKYHIGCVMFFRGNVYDIAHNIERLQTEAEWPLLVMADAEWGIPQRINEGTRFLQNMAIGATGREDYAYEMGVITAKEANALGVHIIFSPVMDVNSNPDNVIINTRSYGEDPELVAKLGTAFIRGAQDNGVLATAKHFPGHGDTDVDSHMYFPNISAGRERLDAVELRPFKAAVAAGVGCIMTAHITFDGIPEMGGRPATLDPYFIGNVLRDEFHFQGLIITDAMRMGGIQRQYWSGDAAVRAINAGVDLVLLPPNFEETFKYVVSAIGDGRIAMATIDRSVRRILRVKQRLGLDKGLKFNPSHLEEVISAPEHLLFSEKVANAAMTLVRDDQNVLPFKAEKLDSILVITVSDEVQAVNRGGTLVREARKRVSTVIERMIDPRTTENEIMQIISEADSVDAIITGVFVKWRDHKGTISLPETTVVLLRNLLQVEKPMAVVAFGSPYTLRQIPAAPTYLCAYETVSLAQQAATRAIFGEIPLTARLPVSIPGLSEIGDGLTRSRRPMQLSRSRKDSLFSNAYDVLRAAIADSIFPGAQIAIIANDTLIASQGFGRLTYDGSAPQVDAKTIYDLASVTKVMATTLVAMRLSETGKIRLDIPVKSYLPEFSGGLKDSVKVRHLLTHSSGMLWWTDLWNRTAKDSVPKYIAALPLDYVPGDSMIYSDLGLILFEEIVKTVTGQSIASLAADWFYTPLGLKDIMFNPSPRLKSRIAPTEIGGNMNRGLIHGQVHDENAYFLGGEAPHAGLFSNAEDLAVLAQMLLNGGVYKHQRFLRSATIKNWAKRQKMPASSSRALGWDTPSDEGSSAGDYFPIGSYGHLGFTGTSIWVDPAHRIAVILLSNRVHPTRKRGGMYQVRRDFHNAVMRALLSVRPPETLQGLR